MVSAAWSPSDRYLNRSRLKAFAQRNGHADYDSLYRWSINDLDGFWRAVDADLGLVWSQPYTKVLDVGEGIAWTKWWIDGRLNYVETALGRGRDEQLAIISEGEEGTVRRVSYGELAELVTHFASGLRATGVKRGDRIAIFMPLTVECVVAVLAIGALGAVYIPIFSGYGVEAIATRLRDSEATMLICADGFYRRGRVVQMKEIADAAVATAPSVRRVVVANRVGADRPLGERDIAWSEVVERGSEPLVPVQTEAEDPFMLIYTSGTTGEPKGAVHVHGGFPVKAAQDLAHCFDLQSGDVLFWNTDIGWMMGPWLIAGGLMLGATLVLYDGTPDYPESDRIWAMVEQHRVTHLGISPTAIRGLMRAGEGPVRRHDRSSLFVLGSTGEPWNDEAWWWYFREVGESRCPIINYSGGTETSGGILGCTTWTAVQPSSFSGPIPGMAADVIDDAGRSVRGGVGELAIRRPWPGMTRGFWRNRERYLETYWGALPNVWVHGDWARVDSDGFWYIQGRSDDTLKIAGKRVGPAEIESAAVAHDAVTEAAAIGVPDELKGEGIVVFAVPAPGVAPTAALEASVADLVAEHLGKPLRPAAVRFVARLPKTRNGKIMRRVIRGAYLGISDLGDLTALEDPGAIEDVRASREVA